MSYSGWKNWQTWNVALWARNDEMSYRFIVNMKKHFGRFNKEKAKNVFMNMMPNGTPDMDGNPRKYRGVDWSAISKAFNEF